MSTAEGPRSASSPRRPTLDPASAAIRNAVRAALAVAGTSVPGIIVAVSGGADSMALLHATAFLHRRGEIRARAVTVDHGLQTVTAEVADRVAAAAESWGMPAEVMRVSIDASEEGLEAAARTARYAALETARAVAGADWILTAHTRSDQAETVLLGLMRGSGTRSLAGMSPLAGRLMRPLLGLDRDQTEASCQAQGIEIWNDPMNADIAFTRVRARRLLAGLETELGQPITANLARTADLCRADADFIDAHAEAAGQSIRGAVSVPVEVFTALDDAVLSRVVRGWVISLGVPGQNLGAVRVAELCALIRDRRRGRLSLPGDAEVVVSGGRAVFQPAAKAR
ncbi:tRNA(Ile)-lysidine synthase [Brevibacterium iodinum ATCC 49514]|uniref:tRNA(Ile)-lysidine synthase n=1 Tax=Brevibacterium iodinum ATCC 49514 TaxID=1255616 RepID=A0A2H1J221_9MICO|nr:tRNA lysidine(34) synthetase TilS [Brevibacterium iodinum]SMX81473.1 tRNA(Ile)-lysidine synthase [Brevibacterium iodinum ATCC 49514]SUW11490.1 tRNA(Ile)-lysidine synthase [Brevibacterium iodinum]